MKIIYSLRLKTIFAFLLLITQTTAQSGGNLQITQSVTASGGDKSSGGSFQITNTTGQSLAGVFSQNGGAGIRSGFWTPALTPTAASITLSGKVQYANGEGKGIGKVMLTLVNVATGMTKTTFTDGNGDFSFDDVEVGFFYIVKAERKLFSFTPSEHAFTLIEESNEIIFFGQKEPNHF